MPGEMTDILVDNGDRVKAGDVIARMRNPELEIKKQEIEGQYKSANEQFMAVMQQLTSPSDPTDPAERIRLEGDQAKLRPQVKYAERTIAADQRARGKTHDQEPHRRPGHHLGREKAASESPSRNGPGAADHRRG